jgi:outer membrane receptor for ferrienterochelin and colicin
MKLSDQLKVNLGYRLSNFVMKDNVYWGWEPRLNARYLINEHWSVKGGYARMNQYMHLLSNTGIGLPTDLWVPATERVRPMRSDQWALGTTKDFEGKDWSITLEGYYKLMDNVLHYKEGASFLETGVLNEDSEISWQDNVTSGQGESYGTELLLQKPTGKLSGWIGYTLSWTKLQFDDLNNGQPFFARYDRRHDFSAVAIYELSEDITLSGTWVYGTGQAITLPNASYQVMQHDPNSINGFSGGYYDYFGALNQQGMSVQDFGSKNSFRMAAYHRLDLAIQFHKQMKRADRTIELGLYNAYNRRNPFFYQINTRNNGQSYLSQISLFPVLPSISWNYKF